MSNPVRRSRRERKANPKYIDSAWDQQTLRLLRTSSDSDSDIEENSQGSTSANDQEADKAQSPDNEYAGSSTANEQGDSSDSSDSSKDLEIQILTPQDSDDARSSVASRAPQARKRRRIQVQKPPSHPDVSHSRGIKHVHHKRAKTTVYTELFGPGVEDLKPVLHARDTWLDARDITLPSHNTLLLGYNRKTNPSYMRLSKDLLTNLNQSVEKQILEEVGKNEQHAKFFPEDVLDQKIALGPWGSQQLFVLRPFMPIDLKSGWNHSTVASMANQRVVPEGKAISNTGTPYHQGWLVNVGSKVQCLAWSPSHTTYQYLAVACKTSSRQRNNASWQSSTVSPAFSPSPTFPTNIQIWRFRGSKRDDSPIFSSNQDASPQLVVSLGIEYGDVREMKWTRISRKPYGNQVGHDFDCNLLTILSSDGHVRVLSLDIVDKDDSVLTKTYVKHPTIDILPLEGIIFTALAWVSASDLAIGASDGTLRLYNVFSTTSTNQPLHPYFTHQLHNTYITSLCPAFPSDCSMFLASSSASGELLLTDLRNPSQDQVHLAKARLPTKALIYAPFTRSFITTVDHSGMTEPKGSSQSSVVCHHLRHFYTSVHLARLPEMSGGATALAGSIHHPSILVGNAKGTVFVTNYLRKVLPSTHSSQVASHNTGAYLQKLCEYEWYSNAPDEPEDVQKIDIFHGHDVRPGISRFHEGFKPEKIDLGTGGLKAKRKEKGENEFAAEVIFEEEQAVTAMDWNPNIQCAGWAAMAWGSGIVRVQDLAYDAS